MKILTGAKCWIIPPGLVLLAAMSAAGCLGGGVPQPPGVPVRDAYHASAGGDALHIQDMASPLRQKKEIPVIYPPQVFAVYVPTRIVPERDVMIGEHWVFLKLTDGDWFPERAERELLATAEATAGDVEFLRARMSSPEKILVPFK